MPDFNAAIGNLQADFQRLADRAEWARAWFHLKAGCIGLHGIGRAGGDGVNGAVCSDQLNPISLELLELTGRAGVIAAEWIFFRRHRWDTVSMVSIHYRVRQPQAYWFVFLLHTLPICFHCWARGPDGKRSPAFMLVGENAVDVWIDNYAQVCVSALAVLKAGSPAKPGGVPNPSDPTLTFDAPQWLPTPEKLDESCPPDRSADARTRPQRPKEVTGQQPGLDQESQAIELLFQHPDWSLVQIAEYIGVGRKALYKWKGFRKAAEKSGRLKPRGPKAGKPPRGHKSRSGDLEAYQDESEDE